MATLLNCNNSSHSFCKCVTGCLSAQRTNSDTSPIGRGLLGKFVGDLVKIQIPGGVREMEIVELITIHQAGAAK